MGFYDLYRFATPSQMVVTFIGVFAAIGEIGWNDITIIFIIEPVNPNAFWLDWNFINYYPPRLHR